MDSNIKQTIEETQHLLGFPVELVNDLSFSNRSAVLRVKAHDDRTLIVKKHADPRSRLNELTAFQYLSPLVAPQLIATSDNVIIMEDLGNGPSVADLLLDDNAEAARAALISWSQSLGKIAATTYGKKPETATSQQVSDRTTRSIAKLANLWDLELPVKVVDEMQEANHFLATSRQYQVLTVYDAACPDNNRVANDGTVRLFDFEYAEWSHAAIDAAYCLTPFCTCWCVSELSSKIREEMFGAYRYLSSQMRQVVSIRRVVDL